MKFLTYIRSHVVLSSGVAFVAVISMIVAGRVASRNSIATTNDSNSKKVSLVDVSDFKNNLSKITADGIVESVSQADLKSQISAPVTSVNVAVGENVNVGETIATLQNADIRAQLDQARAGLQLAQSQYANSGINLESTKKSTIDILRSSFNTADEIINIKLTQFLFKDKSGGVGLISYSTDNTKVNAIDDNYLKLTNGASDWRKEIDSLTVNSNDNEIKSALAISQKNLRILSTILDDISSIISNLLSTLGNQIDTARFSSWQDIVSSSRTSLDTTVKNLSGIDASLSNAQVSYGSSAQAQISSAQAIVKNLEAQLAKTIITAPISGTIAALPLRVGELAQPGQLVSTIVGGGGLHIKAYASGDDISRLKVGAKATIKGSIPGVVVSVAPSVSQVNKKVEVKVSVEDSKASNLVVGENVSIIINTTDLLENLDNNIYLLPIQNIKIIPGNAFVFTVDSESKIVKNPVMLGKVQGDFIEVTNGITSDMKIVSPVYEIEEGESVVIQ